VPDSDVLAAFERLRYDKRILDEEAFLKFITTYDEDLRTLSQVALAKILPFSFSKVTYKHVGLIRKTEAAAFATWIYVSSPWPRIPRIMPWEIIEDVNEVMEQYGRMNTHRNEETRSRFIASLFNKIVRTMSEHAIANKPEGIVMTAFTRNGRIEHYFIVLESAAILFIKVKKTGYLFIQINLIPRHKSFLNMPLAAMPVPMPNIRGGGFLP
jgi:hypothetical protein